MLRVRDRSKNGIRFYFSILPTYQFLTSSPWYEPFDVEVWDQQIEADMTAGTLDVSEAAIADHKAGRTTKQ